MKNNNKKQLSRVLPVWAQHIPIPLPIIFHWSLHALLLLFQHPWSCLLDLHQQSLSGLLPATFNIPPPLTAFLQGIHLPFRLYRGAWPADEGYWPLKAIMIYRSLELIDSHKKSNGAWSECWEMMKASQFASTVSDLLRGLSAQIICKILKQLLSRLYFNVDELFFIHLNESFWYIAFSWNTIFYLSII